MSIAKRFITVGLAILGIALLLSILSLLSENVKKEFMHDVTLSTGKPMIIQASSLVKLPENTVVTKVNLTLVNLRNGTVEVVVGSRQGFTLEPGGSRSISLESLYGLSITMYPRNDTTVRIRISVEGKRFTYAWLSVPALLAFVVGSGCLMIGVIYRLSGLEHLEVES